LLPTISSAFNLQQSTTVSTENTQNFIPPMNVSSPGTFLSLPANSQNNSPDALPSWNSFVGSAGFATLTPSGNIRTPGGTLVSIDPLGGISAADRSMPGVSAASMSITSSSGSSSVGSSKSSALAPSLNYERNPFEHSFSVANNTREISGTFAAPQPVTGGLPVNNEPPTYRVVSSQAILPPEINHSSAAPTTVIPIHNYQPPSSSVQLTASSPQVLSQQPISLVNPQAASIPNTPQPLTQHYIFTQVPITYIPIPPQPNAPPGVQMYAANPGIFQQPIPFISTGGFPYPPQMPSLSQTSAPGISVAGPTNSLHQRSQHISHEPQTVKSISPIPQRNTTVLPSTTSTDHIIERRYTSL
jgi:hypothetical protein